jgi:hypothetical protein
MSDQEDDNSTDTDISIDPANAETPINCTTCASGIDPCSGLLCRLTCLWHQVGKKCNDRRVETVEAVKHLRASMADPESSVSCAHWKEA